MGHSRSKDFLRPGQGVIFVPTIPDRPRNTTTFYGRFCPPPPGIHIRRGTHNVKGKTFLIVERCNGVVNHVLIQNDKRRIMCCVRRCKNIHMCSEMRFGHRTLIMAQVLICCWKILQVDLTQWLK
jgi:hypothetical protein